MSIFSFSFSKLGINHQIVNVILRLNNYIRIKSKFLQHCSLCQIISKRARAEMAQILHTRECNVCAPPRLPLEVFKQLSHLPDPIPDEGDHYIPFSEIYGHLTTKQHMPSKIIHMTIRLPHCAIYIFNILRLVSSSRWYIRYVGSVNRIL